MKKKMILLIGLIIAGLITWLGFSSISSLKEKEGRQEIQKNLSSIFESFGIHDDSYDETVLLVYFNSECEYCQWEVREISENLERFENITLAFVSHEPEEQARAFLAKHNLEQSYLKVSADRVISSFDGGVPQIFIFKMGLLEKHFRGEVKIEGILKALAD